VSDNVYAVELDNGPRVLALPGSDDSIRGLTVDASIVADEAARLSEDMPRCEASVLLQTISCDSASGRASVRVLSAIELSDSLSKK
jgi:hypothetical protein